MIRASSLLALAVLGACANDEMEPTSDCGPTSGTVLRVIDGDTIDLDTGDRVRYLMVDTPETTNGKNDCYGAEASARNRELVYGKKVSLTYDVTCRDGLGANGGRLLAYVFVADQEVNRLLVDDGYACVNHIPPNGDDRRAEFQNAELLAKGEKRGLWGACTEEEIQCN